jgi:hypothetical protein
MTLWTAVWLMVALVLGWLGSTFTEGRRHRRRAKRARQDRLEQRREAHSERRRQFELTTLSDSYGALSRLARAAARVHLLDLTVARPRGTYGGHQVDDDGLDEEHRLATLEVSRLAGLILDDELRQMVTAAHDAVVRVPLGQKTVAQGEAQFNHAFEKVDVAQCVCAERIRELYQSDVA